MALRCGNHSIWALDSQKRFIAKCTGIYPKAQCTQLSFILPITTIPPLKPISMNAEIIQHAPNTLLHHILQALRPRIKRRHGRENHGPHPPYRQQVLQVDIAQRRLARHQHQRPALLQRHISGARDQIVAKAYAHSGERLHATGHYDHAVVQEGSTGNWSRHVACRVDSGGEGMDFGFRPIGLVFESCMGPFAHYQVCFYG